MARKVNNGYVLIFAAGMLWGTIGLFVKQMEECGSTPAMTSFLRVLFAALAMLPLCIVRDGWRSLLVDGKTLLYCALLGVVCHGVYNIFYSHSVTITGVSVSAVLLNIAPIFTLIFSAALFSERITKQKMIAIILNIIGCILTVTNGCFDMTFGSGIGILFGICAGFCYAMTAIFGRFAAKQTSPVVMSFYSYSFAAMFLLFWTRPWSKDMELGSGILLWGSMFALIPTSLAYVLYYQGLQRIVESSRVPVIASVETVVAALIGIVIYRERLGIFSIFGVLLVLVSIFIMNPSKKRHRCRAWRQDCCCHDYSAITLGPEKRQHGN